MNTKIKLTIFYLSMIVFIYPAFSQGVSINNNNAAPDPSAMLDVQSTEKGMLVPRMTQAQRNAISNPAEGLLVYDTDFSTFWYYDGRKWVNLAEVTPSLPKTTTTFDNISHPELSVTLHNVKMNQNGDVTIIYFASNRLYASLYRNNQWMHAGINFPLAESLATSAFDFDMDENGDVVVAFIKSFQTFNRIFTREFRNGAWQPEELRSPFGSSASNPSVAMNDNGKILLTWSQADAITSRIFLSVYESGNWTDPSSNIDYFNPNWGNPAMNIPATAPRVAISNNANAILAWTHNNSGNIHLYLAELNNGVWSKPANLNDRFSLPGYDAITLLYLGVARNSNAGLVLYRNIEFMDDDERIFRAHRTDSGWNQITLISAFGPFETMLEVDAYVSHNGRMAITATKWLDGAQIRTKFIYENGSWLVGADYFENSGNYRTTRITCNDSPGISLEAGPSSINGASQVFYINNDETFNFQQYVSPVQSIGSIRCDMNNAGSRIITWTGSNRLYISHQP
jgi:hypothetical protein